MIYILAGNIQARSKSYATGTRYNFDTGCAVTQAYQYKYFRILFDTFRTFFDTVIENNKQYKPWLLVSPFSYLNTMVLYYLIFIIYYLLFSITGIVLVQLSFSPCIINKFMSLCHVCESLARLHALSFAFGYPV